VSTICRNPSFGGALALGLLMAGCGSDPGSLLGPTATGASTTSAPPFQAVGATQAAPSPAAGVQSAVRFKGKVESVSASGLKVSGVTIEIDSRTTVRRARRAIAVTELTVGEFVTIEGTLLFNGHVVAVDIQDTDDVVVFRAKVKSGGEQVTLVGVDIDIKVDVSVRVLVDCRRGSVVDIQEGQTVEVTGHLQSDGSVLVVKIKVSVSVAIEVSCPGEGPGPDDDDDDNDDDDDDDD